MALQLSDVADSTDGLFLTAVDRDTGRRVCYAITTQQAQFLRDGWEFGLDALARAEACKGYRDDLGMFR